jgi:hypothetical protein
MGRGPNWSEEELHILRDCYGQIRVSAIQARLKKVRGFRRSRNAVIIKANRLGLTVDEPAAEFTVKEAAEMLGVHKYTLHSALSRGVAVSVLRDNRTLIPHAEIEKLEAYYQPIPPGYDMSKSELMKLLGYSETHATRLLKGGVIRGVKHGKRWHVDRAHAIELAEQMKSAGETRLNLKDYDSEYLQEQRRKCRIYSVTVRKQKRREERMRA